MKIKERKMGFIRKQLFNFAITQLITRLIILIMVFAGATTLLIVGIHGLKNDRQYGFNLYISIGFFVMGIIILITFYFGINPIFYSKLRKYEKTENEKELIKLAEIRGDRGLAAIISLYKINSKSFKSIFQKHLETDMYSSDGIKNLLSQLILLEESIDYLE